MSQANMDWTPAYDRHGKITPMVRSGGYVMCRRPGAKPFVLSEKDWRKLPHEPLADGAEFPLVTTYGVETGEPKRSRLTLRSPV